MWREHLVARLQTRLLRHWGISPRGRPLLRVLRAVDTEGDGVSACYTEKEFKDAGTEPCELCYQLTGVTRYPQRFMACDYHEGYIDGYQAGARENKC